MGDCIGLVACLATAACAQILDIDAHESALSSVGQGGTGGSGPLIPSGPPMPVLDEAAECSSPHVSGKTIFDFDTGDDDWTPFPLNSVDFPVDVVGTNLADCPPGSGSLVVDLQFPGRPGVQAGAFGDILPLSAADDRRNWTIARYLHIAYRIETSPNAFNLISAYVKSNEHDNASCWYDHEATWEQGDWRHLQLDLEYPEDNCGEGAKPLEVDRTNVNQLGINLRDDGGQQLGEVVLLVGKVWVE